MYKLTKKYYGELYNIKTTWACGNSWITQSLIPVPNYVSDIGCGECNYCRKRGRKMPESFKEHFIKIVYHPTINEETHEYKDLLEVTVDGVEWIECQKALFNKIVENIKQPIFSTYELYTIEAKVKIGLNESLRDCKAVLIKSLKVFTSDVMNGDIVENRVCIFNSKGNKS